MKERFVIVSKYILNFRQVKGYWHHESKKFVDQILDATWFLEYPTVELSLIDKQGIFQVEKIFVNLKDVHK